MVGNLPKDISVRIMGNLMGDQSRKRKTDRKKKNHRMENRNRNSGWKREFA